jgi:RNA polymerase sigma factor (sigma-70 family)
MRGNVLTAAAATRQSDFEAFFREQHARLYRVAFLLTGSAAEAQDLAQEALARAFERWERIRTMDSPAGYVYRILVHLNHRRLRRLRVQARRLLPGIEMEDPASAAETRSDVMRALLALRPAHREALVLVEWMGLDAAGAAEVLGIEPVSVRARLHRARKAFRQELGEGYE